MSPIYTDRGQGWRVDGTGPYKSRHGLIRPHNHHHSAVGFGETRVTEECSGYPVAISAVGVICVWLGHKCLSHGRLFPLRIRQLHTHIQTQGGWYGWWWQRERALFAFGTKSGMGGRCRKRATEKKTRGSLLPFPVPFPVRITGKRILFRNAVGPLELRHLRLGDRALQLHMSGRDSAASYGWGLENTPTYNLQLSLPTTPQMKLKGGYFRRDKGI